MIVTRSRASLLAGLAVISSCGTVFAGTGAGHRPGEATRSDPPPAVALSLERALALAEERSPRLAARRASLQAATGRVEQARLRPNPELEQEVENFGGSAGLAGLAGAEKTTSLHQRIPLGGKLRGRRELARADRGLAELALEGERLDVLAETKTAYYRVLIAQRRLSLAEELLELAQRFGRTVRARVEAGKVSPVESIRSDVAVAEAVARRNRARRRLTTARSLLAANWGETEFRFGSVADRIPPLSPPPPAGQLRACLAGSPAVTRLDHLIARQRRLVQLEDARRIPDPTLSVGRRRLEELGQSAWVAAVSVPLPLFDRNQGERRAARHELDAVRADAESAGTLLRVRLTASAERVASAVEQAMTATRTLVPSARRAFEAVEAGYREGKFSFLEVLDSERSLFEAHSFALDSIEEFLLADTALERLVAPCPALETREGPRSPEKALGEKE